MNNTINFLLKPVYPNDYIIPKEMKEDASVKYSPPLSTATKAVETGLNSEEVDKYMPLIIGVSSNSESFQAKVAEYFNEVSWTVPYEGLEIKFDVDNSGFPINDTDKLNYLLYKIVKKDITVATGENIKYKEMYQWTLEDLSLIKEQENEKFESKNEALSIYSQLYNLSKKDEKEMLKARRILVANKASLNLSLVDINELSHIETFKKLDSLVQSDPQALVSASEDPLLNYIMYATLFIEYSLTDVENEAVFFRGDKVASSVTQFPKVLKNDPKLFGDLRALLRSEARLDNLVPAPKKVESTEEK